MSITRMDTNAYVSLAIEGKIASKVRNTIFLSYEFSCMICFVSSCFFVCLIVHTEIVTILMLYLAEVKTFRIFFQMSTNA